VLVNFTALVAVNNTLVVVLAGCAHAAASWPCDSLLVSLDIVFYVCLVSCLLYIVYAII